MRSVWGWRLFSNICRYNTAVKNPLEQAHSRGKYYITSLLCATLRTDYLLWKILGYRDKFNRYEERQGMFSWWWRLPLSMWEKIGVRSDSFLGQILGQNGFWGTIWGNQMSVFVRYCPRFMWGVPYARLFRKLLLMARSRTGEHNNIFSR